MDVGGGGTRLVRVVRVPLKVLKVQYVNILKESHLTMHFVFKENT